MSLLVFGVDETVDPARFALLPVRARELLPGLLAAALVGVPGRGHRADRRRGWWSPGRGTLPLTAAAVLAMPLGVVTLRAAGPGGHRGAGRGAGVPAVPGPGLRRRRPVQRRRSRLGSNLLGSLADSDPARLRAALGRGGPGARLVARSAGPGRSPPMSLAATGSSPGSTCCSPLGLVVGSCGGAGRTSWTAGSPRRSSSGGDSRPVKESGWVDRIFPATPAGGVAARTLRYWRRDPRYLAGVAGFLIGPVILIVLQLINPDGNGLVAVFAPTLVGLLVGPEPGPGPVVRRLGALAARRVRAARRRRPGRPGVVGPDRLRAR